MFDRYRRHVPKAHRDLIRRHGLKRPNWYIGSAESSHSDPPQIDPSLLAEVERLKAELSARHDRR